MTNLCLVCIKQMLKGDMKYKFTCKASILNYCCNMIGKAKSIDHFQPIEVLSYLFDNEYRTPCYGIDKEEDLPLESKHLIRLGFVVFSGGYLKVSHELITIIDMVEKRTVMRKAELDYKQALGNVTQITKN